MNHKIELLGDTDYGFNTRLVCPEDCTDQKRHQDEWDEAGCDLLTPVEQGNTVIGVIEVQPEWRGTGENAEFWLNPIVYDED